MNSLHRYKNILMFLFVLFIIGQTFIMFYVSKVKETSTVQELDIDLRRDISLPVVRRYSINIDRPFERIHSLLKGTRETHLSKWYSNFTITQPFFIDKRSTDLFFKNPLNLNHLGGRPREALYGDIIIVRNGTVDIRDDCGYRSRGEWIHPYRNVSKSQWFPALIPLAVPDAQSFQHFLDGIMPKIVLASPLLQNKSVKILIPRIKDKIIFEILQRFNISTSQLVHPVSQDPIYGANVLIYPCITPPVHPELWQEARRIIGAPAQLQILPSDAYIVLIARQTHKCGNCGRLVLNQDKLLNMLYRRYGTDKVKTFNRSTSLADCLDLFGKARVILGVHGGGLYNVNFAPSKTVVVEFMPTLDDGRMQAAAHSIIWTMSQLLDQIYWRISCTPVNRSNDVYVDVNLVERLLDVVDKRL